MSMLELRDVSVAFGGLRAVDGVDLQVEQGDRHGLIGPNGAGKSTLFRLVAGGLRPSTGSIAYDGRDITRLSRHKRARLGIGQTFQHSSLFGSLSCAENVQLALQRAGDGASPESVAESLDRFSLAERAHVPAATLSHGERRQLELALALVTEPRLLLLDEPAAGLSAEETERFAEMLAALPDELTILLIEHDLDLLFRAMRTVTVLHLGSVIASGTPDEVRADDEVHSVYVGGSSEEELFIDDGGPDGAARG
jgi:branched-chain amino acid transport system ATP-binding protein